MADINPLNPLGPLLDGIDNFLNSVGQGNPKTQAFAQSMRGLLGIARMLTGAIGDVSNAIRSYLTDALFEVAGYFQKLITDAIDFDLSITGLLQQAERTRKYFSELADEMNFFSSATGNTSEAMGILLRSTGKSAAGIGTLKSAFITMVDSGADSKKFIEDMLPLIGDFEVKTGVGAQQFGTMAAKFQQMFGEKKGITKDIQDLQKALIGTGLKGAQLEQTMQGLTEAADKLAFATQGSTLNIKQLSQAYSQTTAVFKAFGINTQTTSNFLNGLIDPENIEKNMLLMNKMGVSYQEFNDMLNSGQGQDKFFDKILNNVGKVAQEANLIQDASTRYKYLKDTLGLPPEIANKLMKVTPSRMQAELRKIKREMEDAEKKEKWRKELKAREEKYEEAMMFLRMEMVKPLVDIINKNRGAIMRIMQALVPVFKLISEKLATFLEPFSYWLEDIAKGIDAVMSEDLNVGDFIEGVIDDFMETFKDQLNWLLDSKGVIPTIEDIGAGLGRGIMKGIASYLDFMPESIKKIFKASKRAVGLDDDTLMGDITKSFEKQNETLFGTAKIVSKEISDRFEENKLFTSGTFNKDVKIEKNEKFKESKGFEKNFEKLSDALKEGNKEDAVKNLVTLKRALLNDDKNNKEEVQAYIEGLQMSIFGTTLKKTKWNEFFKNKSGPKTPKAQKTNSPSVPKPDLNTQTDLKTVNESLSDAEVKAAVERLMNNKNFMTSVTTTLVSVKDKRISELERQVKLFTESEEKLRAEFNKLKDESTVGILMKWNNELFGPQDDSIKNILLSIDESLVVDGKTKTGGPKQAATGPSDISKFTTAVNNSPISSLTGASTGLVSYASSTNVKNIQVKQALYLKSIADSTFDSAKYLRYIGTNLVFGPNGLIVSNNTNTIAGLKRRNLAGKDVTGILSGFDVGTEEGGS